MHFLGKWGRWLKGQPTPPRFPSFRARLNVEYLEDRLALSWAGVPPVFIAPPSSAVGVILNNLGDAQGNAAITANEVDYYRFTAPISGSYLLSALTPSSSLDTVLGLFSASGQRLAYNDDISSSNRDSRLTATLSGGSLYYFGITNYTGTPGGSYTWSVDGPIRDDSFEENDSLAQAANLGTLSSTRTISNLVMGDSQDWFRFTTSGTGTSSHYVQINFTNSQGNLDLRLFNSNGTQLASSQSSTANSERINLTGLPAGTYYVQAFGLNGVLNPSYSLTIVPPPAQIDDIYEENDSFAAAYNLGTLTTQQTISGLVMGDSQDWFRFTTSGAGTSSHYVQINFLHSQGDLDLRLFNSNGTQLAISDGVTDSERINLTGLAPGTYYVQVYGYNGALNPSYSLTILPPTQGDDAYEENDSFGAAFNLGTVTTQQTITGLAMADSQDWFRFTTNAAGTSASYVQINFLHSQGDLDMRLYNSNGTQLGISEGVVDFERINLTGLAAGTYYVQAYGYNGVFNPNYSLTINPPVAGANQVLYLSFDGANISRSDLVRYAGSDWAGMVNHFDADGNGISVQPFLVNRADREQIISQMISLVQQDLNPFGITVQRITGLAVENQRATTIFLGPSTLSNGFYHVACDIDVGNNNLTDIAFVGDEDWGSAADTALAMADVTLHEAGHTYGLYHVSSGNALESMGLRYNTSQNFWVQNTSFMNQTFNILPGHGPNTTQNSFQVMSGTFTGAPAAGSSANLSYDWLREELLYGQFYHHHHGFHDHGDHDHGDHDHEQENHAGCNCSLCVASSGIQGSISNQANPMDDLASLYPGLSAPPAQDARSALALFFAQQGQAEQTPGFAVRAENVFSRGSGEIDLFLENLRDQDFPGFALEEALKSAFEG